MPRSKRSQASRAGSSTRDHTNQPRFPDGRCAGVPALYMSSTPATPATQISSASPAISTQPSNAVSGWVEAQYDSATKSWTKLWTPQSPSLLPAYSLPGEGEPGINEYFHCPGTATKSNNLQEDLCPEAADNGTTHQPELMSSDRDQDVVRDNGGMLLVASGTVMRGPISPLRVTGSSTFSSTELSLSFMALALSDYYFGSCIPFICNNTISNSSNSSHSSSHHLHIFSFTMDSDLIPQVIEYLSKKGYSKTEAMLRAESSGLETEGRPIVTPKDDFTGRKFRQAFGEA